MKKALLLFFMAIAISYGGHSQIPLEGLVGFYELDNGTYIDSSTSGYDLELVDIGGLLLPSTNRFGESDKALKFINQYLNMDSNPNVFDFDSDSMFSLCTWIKIDETVIDWTGLLNNWAGFGVGGYYLGITPEQRIRWNVNADPPIDSDPVTTGQWTHIAVTYDGNTSNLYIDGILVGSQNYGVGITSSPYSFTVACQADVTTNQFPGVMDEILVYERPLTAQEVMDIFNVLSIEDVDAFSAKVIIAPNPVDYTFTFDYDQTLGTLVSYTLTDLKGSAVMEGAIDNLHRSVDISPLEAGMYLLTFRTIDNIAITKRVIKK